MIQATGLTKRYGEKTAVDTLYIHRPARHGDWIPGTERGRQVHHDAADRRLGRTHRQAPSR